MKSRLRETLAQKQAEIDVLKRTSEELSKGKQRIEDLISKMEKDSVAVEEAKQRLKDKERQLADMIAKTEADSKDLNIDESFGPTMPLYKQLLDAFAEENAIVDAIYYLGEGLRKGAIDLEVFLKHTRELSRRQFFLRAIMQRCREKAGLTY